MFSRNGSGGIKIRIYKSNEQVNWWQVVLMVGLIIALVLLALTLPGCAVEPEEPVARGTYNCDVYTEQGCAKFVVASGGEIEVQSGGTVDVQDGATIGLGGTSSFGDIDATGTITAATGFVGSGNVSLGDAIGDNIYVYGQMRSYDGSDNWADISDVSALGRGNGWHASYNVTDGGSDQFQALFANTQVCTTTNTGSIYGLEAKATYKATEGSGPYAMAYGVFGKVTAKSSGGTHSTIPYAYPVYSILDVAASNTMAEAVNYFAENANSGTETASYILKTHSSGDTWDYGIHMGDATINTAEFVGSNGETIGNTVDGLWTFGGAGLYDGAADVIQLRVQGHSVQSNNPDLFVVENSAGTDLFAVDNTGVVDLDGELDVAGDATLGDAITDNIYVYGQMRSYNGSSNWVDVPDLSALGRGNGWHASYNVTDGGSDQFQALFANTQVCTTTNTGSIYGLEAKATYKATEGSGPYAMAYGVFGKVTAKSSGGTHSTIPYAYPIYSILDVAASNTMAEAVNYFAENANSGTETASYILKTHSSGDTWDYGIHLSDATINTAEIVGSNGETLKNTTDTAWQVGGFLGLEEASVVDLGAGFTLTPGASYQPVTNSTGGSITSDTSTAIVDGAVPGVILIIVNEDAQDIVLKDAANTQLGGDITLTGGADDSITLLWDGTDWTCLSVHDN